MSSINLTTKMSQICILLRRQENSNNNNNNNNNTVNNGKNLQLKIAYRDNAFSHVTESHVNLEKLTLSQTQYLFVYIDDTT